MLAKILDGSVPAFGVYYAHDKWPEWWLDLHKRIPQFTKICSRKKQPPAFAAIAPAMPKPAEPADLPCESMGYRDVQASAKLRGV